jgi:hypothetical protein
MPRGVRADPFGFARSKLFARLKSASLRIKLQNESSRESTYPLFPFGPIILGGTAASRKF